MAKPIKLLAPLCALALLTGCASGGGAPAAGAVRLDPAAEVSGSITVWSWDVAATALKRLAKSYTDQHPGTTVNVVDVGYDNAYDKMSVGFQANTGLPDVITVETDRMPGYISKFPKGFTDLSPLLESAEGSFDPSKISASSDPQGRVLSMPWDSGTVGLFVRKDYLDEAGVRAEDLQTWDQTLLAGEKLASTTGHTLLSTDLSTGALFRMMLQQQGQGLFTGNGDINVASPEAVRALTLLKTMNDKGLINNVKGWDGRVSATKDGKSAIHPEAVWWIGTLTGEMPELASKFQVLPLPAFAPGGVQTSNSGGSTLAVPSQAKNPQLAGAFLKFVLADTANQVSMMATEGLFPSYLPALSDKIFHQPEAYFGGQKVYELFADQTAKIPSIPYTNDNAKADDIVAAAVVASVVNGQDPKTTLTAAAGQLSTATGRKVAS